jgi:putative hydrolase of the HAD superfamily
VYAEVGQRFGSQFDPTTIASRFRIAFARQEQHDQEAGLRTREERERARWQAIVGEVLHDVKEANACFQALYQYFAQPAAWRCDADAATVLPALARREYRLGLASNFDHRLRGLLAGIPALQSAITHVVISSEVGWRKPAPEFFARLCSQAGMSPEQVLLVGDDMANDWTGARAAGMQALLLDPRRRSTVEESARIERLADLLDRL